MRLPHFFRLSFSPDRITNLFDIGGMSGLSNSPIALETLVMMRKHAVLLACCQGVCTHLKSKEGLA